MIQKSNPDDLFEGIFIEMIGIYKITNPNGKIYIGQSVDIEIRLSNYKKLSQSISEQPAIYNSLLKHGVENHIFEIIEECIIELLNERERFWQEYYDCVNNGLNCKYTTTKDKTGHLSDETKNKISLSQKGKKRFYKSGKHPNLGIKRSVETIEKMVNNRNYIVTEEYKKRLSEMYKGKKQTKEHSEKRRIANIGKKRSEETKLKLSILKQNMSDETKLKMSLAKKGTKQSIETRLKRSESMKKTLEAKRIKQIY